MRRRVEIGDGGKGARGSSAPQNDQALSIQQGEDHDRAASRSVPQALSLDRRIRLVNRVRAAAGHRSQPAQQSRAIETDVSVLQQSIALEIDDVAPNAVDLLTIAFDAPAHGLYPKTYRETSVDFNGEGDK
jgi:hypothetical protein